MENRDAGWSGDIITEFSSFILQFSKVYPKINSQSSTENFSIIYSLQKKGVEELKKRSGREKESFVQH